MPTFGHNQEDEVHNRENHNLCHEVSHITGGILSVIPVMAKSANNVTEGQSDKESRTIAVIFSA
jgi:hypothetical protein